MHPITTRRRFIKSPRFHPPAERNLPALTFQFPAGIQQRHFIISERVFSKIATLLQIRIIPNQRLPIDIMERYPKLLSFILKDYNVIPSS